MHGTEKEGKQVVFIQNAGGCICTKSVYEGKTPLKWCFREESVNPADNGWRFIGRDDDEAYIRTASNNVVLDFNTVANIEPAVLAIYSMPVGTDVFIERGADGKVIFFDSNTGKEIRVERL